ncbi:MAG: gliding motility-associated C-terminal domain-containing protein, partial [Cellulophaga sp.]
EAIAANEGAFSSPATEAEVQTMINRVNTAESLLVNIGTDATNGNNTNTSTVTAVDLNNITGVSGATSGNESAYREAIAANEGTFSSPATESEVQTMINRVNTAESLLANIGTDAANGNNTNTSTVTAIDLNNITGVSGATSGNESAYSEAIAANEGTFSSPATEAEVQTMINRVNTVESLLANIGTDAANGNNTNTSTITAVDLNNIAGVSRAISANESAYLTSIAADEGPFSSPATETEVQVMIDLVNTSQIALSEILEDSSSIGGANNINMTSVSAIQLSNIIGITGVNLAEEAAYQQEIEAETGFSNLPSLMKVQAIIDRVNAIAILVENSNDPSDGNPSIVDLANVGVTGAVKANEELYERVIANVILKPTTLAELQKIIDGVNKVIEIVEKSDEPADGSPSKTDLNEVGLENILPGHVDEYEIAIYQSNPKPRNREELQKIIDEVNTIAILVANSNNPSDGNPSVTAITGVGSDRVVPENESKYEEVLAKTDPKPRTLQELQKIIDEVNAIAIIVGNSNNPSDGNPSEQNLIAVGVENVVSNRLGLYEVAIALASPALQGLSELQDIIDAVNVAENVISEILEDSASAGGANNLNTTAITVVQLAGIAGIKNVDLSLEAQYQSKIANETGFSNLPTLTEIQAIIDAVNASVSAITEILEDSDSEGGNVNGNNIAISLVQLTAIVGIEDVDSNLITQYRGEIQKETGFSNLPTLEEIQVLIDRVNYDNEDDDGDGVINLEDAFPDDPEESLDVDGDGIGANADYDDNDSSIGIKAPGLKVPNAITPNGDGINDFWIIEGIENYPNSNVSVYNRYGHLVFEAKGYRNTWNAAYKENTKKLPVGSYLYIIDLGDGSEPTSAWLYINY